VLTVVSNVPSGVYLADTETSYKAVHGEIICGITLQWLRFAF